MNIVIDLLRCFWELMAEMHTATQASFTDSFRLLSHDYAFVLENIVRCQRQTDYQQCFRSSTMIFANICSSEIVHLFSSRSCTVMFRLHVILHRQIMIFSSVCSRNIVHLFGLAQSVQCDGQTAFSVEHTDWKSACIVQQVHISRRNALFEKRIIVFATNRS